jgi:hypothetical protein
MCSGAVVELDACFIFRGKPGMFSRRRVANRGIPPGVGQEAGTRAGLSRIVPAPRTRRRQLHLVAVEACCDVAQRAGGDVFAEEAAGDLGFCFGDDALATLAGNRSTIGQAAPGKSAAGVMMTVSSGRPAPSPIPPKLLECWWRAGRAVFRQPAAAQSPTTPQRVRRRGSAWQHLVRRSASSGLIPSR